MKWIDDRLFLGQVMVAGFHYNAIDGNSTGLFYVIEFRLPGMRIKTTKFKNQDEAKQAAEILVNNWIALSNLKFK